MQATQFLVFCVLVLSCSNVNFWFYFFPVSTLHGFWMVLQPRSIFRFPAHRRCVVLSRYFTWAKRPIFRFSKMTELIRNWSKFSKVVQNGQVNGFSGTNCAIDSKVSKSCRKVRDTNAEQFRFFIRLDPRLFPFWQCCHWFYVKFRIFWTKMLVYTTGKKYELRSRERNNIRRLCSFSLLDSRLFSS